MAVVKRETYAVMIPQNINLVELLIQFPISVPNAKDHLLYLLSIIKINVGSHEADSFVPQEFTRISSTAIQKKVDNYSSLFRWLAERRIIEIDDGYIINEKRKGYKFTNEYVTDLKEELMTNRPLIKKIKKEVILSQNLDLGYGYEPLWCRYKDVASRLNLKSTKMKQGLIKHNFISSDVNAHRECNPTTVFFYKNLVNDRGYGSDVLFINDDFTEQIRNLAMEFPMDFPKISNRRRVSSNLLTSI